MLKKLFGRPIVSENKVRVLFVCTANVCRSPLAEGLLRQRGKDYQDCFDLTVDSCGIQAGRLAMAPDVRVRNLAQREGIDLSGIKSRRLSERDYSNFDVMFAMDSSHLEALEAQRPVGATTEIRLFRESFASNAEIPDPYYGSLQGFDSVFELLSEAVDQFLNDTADVFKSRDASIS